MEVQVSFNQDELTALSQLLDVAIKATGLQGAKAALVIVAKLEAAVAEANKNAASLTDVQQEVAGHG